MSATVHLWPAIGATCCAALLGVASSQASASVVDVPLTEGTVVRLADVREGAEALARRDEYIDQLSPFDRQVRTRTAQPVSVEQFLAFAASQVVPWTNEDVAM